MHEIIAKINSLNQGGYVFIQMEKGDIFLYHSKTTLELPDVDAMDHLTKDQYAITIELIIDRELYEQAIDGGIFTKTLLLKNIRALRKLRDVKI